MAQLKIAAGDNEKPKERGNRHEKPFLDKNLHLLYRQRASDASATLPTTGHRRCAGSLSTIVNNSCFVNCVTDLRKVEDEDTSIVSNAADRNRDNKKLGALLGPLAWDHVSQEESRYRTEVDQVHSSMPEP